MDIQVPSEYPFEPPKVGPSIRGFEIVWAYSCWVEVKFITKIWHPNVSSQTGVICLDVLKEAW